MSVSVSSLYLRVPLRKFKRFFSFTNNAKVRSRVYVSGIQPSGVPHLGNYYGFIRQWVNLQNKESPSSEMFLAVADYHSLSLGFPPAKEMRENMTAMVAALLACGVDPNRTVLYQQSAVAEHTNLMYILSSLQTVARLTRMPQFKEKAHKYKQSGIPVNLQNYPILQAADVLLYKGTHVPVGDDQTQHILLMRDLAHKFNAVLGRDFFPLPVQVNSAFGRLKSLQSPSQKMSKSSTNDRSRILITDSKELISLKCKKALSDTCSRITYDPLNRPAISNLLYLYATTSSKTVDEALEACKDLDTVGLKMKLAESVNTVLEPIRAKFKYYIEQRKLCYEILEMGACIARKKARVTMEEVREMLGIKMESCGREVISEDSSYKAES